MNTEDLMQIVNELPASSGQSVAQSLARLIEKAVEKRQQILGQLYREDNEFSVTFSHGTSMYRISEPRYDEAEFIKNKRRGPGGKYYPFIEIEFPCRVEVTSSNQKESLRAEGRVNLHDCECTVESAMVPVPDEAMEKIHWHCREFSFLLD